MLDPRQQIERLKAVDSQRLEKVVVRCELFSRHLQMRSREIEDFGEFIRESIAEWSRRYRGCAPEGEKGKEAGKPKGGETAPPVV